VGTAMDSQVAISGVICVSRSDVEQALRIRANRKKQVEQKRVVKFMYIWF